MQKKTQKPRYADIVLVNPPLSQEERYGVKFKAGGQTPPTGLAMIAAVCRRNKYDVAIVDAAALALNYKETVNKILEYRPKYIGFTAVTISIFNALEIANRIKKLDKEKLHSNTKLILGGAHITGAPSETFERFGDVFDIYILGEGEDTIIDLLNALEKEKPLSGVDGIAYVNKGKLNFTGHREIIKDLDKLPPPAWDLLPDLDKYYLPPAHTVKMLPAALMMSSRGCPGQCTFCDNKVFGRIPRANSADYMIDLIKHLQKRYGIKEVQFRDDHFIFFKKRNKEFCQKLIDQKINIAWTCEGRVDMVDEDILKLMKKAGCWQIWYGIESGSDKVLATIKKYTTVEKIKKAIYATKKTGISPCGFFMIGLPNETEEDIKKTIKLLVELPIDEFHICHLSPYPGTELYYTAQQYGRFDNDWKKMSAWKIIFVPNGLNKEKLLKYSNMAWKKFYYRPRIILNYLRRIRSFRHLKVYFNAFMGFLIYSHMKKR